jgi:hypothetical protein
MLYQGFIGTADTPQSLSADAEDLINWYLEPLPQNAKSQAMLVPTSGFQTWTTTTDIGGRALFTMNDRTLGIMGSGAYGFDSTGVATRYGSMVQDSNPGQIAMNGPTGNQALFASGTNAYCLNLSTNAFTQVLNGKASMIGMLDGYFIAFDAATPAMWLSNLNDGLTWDPTQFARRNAAPDKWKAMLVNPPDIWLIGERTGDVWYDAGNFPFPFAPRAGLNFKYGIVAPHSLKAAGFAVLWLSQDDTGSGIVVRTRGYAPQRVSTYPLENAIAGYARTSRIDDAEGMVYQDRGHTFYALSFPSVPATWLLDLETNRWSKAGKWDNATNQYLAWHPRVHTFAFGQHLVGDRSTGVVSTMDQNFGSELDGKAIRRVRRAPGIFNEHRLLNIRNIEVYLESGLGTVSGQGVDPIIMWRTSDDGGHTWGRYREAKAGKMGQYQRRVRFWRMGVSRDRVNEMVVSDPIPWRIVSAYINNDTSRQAA